VDLGNTIVVIEHNLDVIRRADWILDLGPEGGEQGGRLLAMGPPETVAGIPGSSTGAFLRTPAALSPKKPNPRPRRLRRGEGRDDPEENPPRS
jgi:excinuclease ABC subunit A